LIAVVGATRCLEASPITYAVLVDTSSIAGVSGNVDFQFNPGALITDPAFVTISMFVSDGTLAGVPVRLGDVTGTLPDVTIRNTTAFNYNTSVYVDCLCVWIDIGIYIRDHLFVKPF